jgi:hypothetical protein
MKAAKKKTVTQEYLNGIKEGREYLKKEKPDTATMRDILDTLRRTLKGFTGPVAETLRGERDFWINQLKLRK